ncbi:MAG: methylmalonyl Co-A mutase-associated GTPase MeaB, partial [Actinomycetota bacterium]
EGFDELWDAIRSHRSYQERHGLLEARRRRRIEREIREIVAERYRERVTTGGADLLEELTDQVVARECDPYEAADKLIASF